MKHIDDISIDLAQALPKGEIIYKSIPPKLYYRLRAWLKTMRGKSPQMDAHKLREVITEKAEEIGALRELKKNEMMASIYGDGIVKFDFGAEVPEKARKAAVAWAKRKGLAPVEAGLNKSMNSIDSIICATSNAPVTTCTKRLKWQF